MILILAAAVMAATQPSSPDLNEIVKPYATCLNRQRKKLVSKFNSDGTVAANDSEAAEMSQHIKAQIKSTALQLCARDRALARKRALAALEKAYRNKPISADPALVDSLLTYLDELDFPFIIPIAVPIP
jgi:hypothetical protein